MSRTGGTVAEFIENRKLQEATKRALIQLERDPEASYREVARAQRVDVGRLYRLAQKIPGLVELRAHRRSTRAA